MGWKYITAFALLALWVVIWVGLWVTEQIMFPNTSGAIAATVGCIIGLSVVAGFARLLKLY